MSATLLNNVTAAIGSIARGFASSPVQIGSVVLQGVEVPSELVFAGQQQTVVHKLPGGDRVINTLGADPGPITFSGMLTGPATSSRYQALDAMRVAGSPVSLMAAGQSFQAIVTAFRYTFQQRGAVVPYELTVEIIPQLASAQSTAGTSILSSLIGSDAASAVTSVGNTIASATSYVATLATTAQSIVGNVLPVASLVGAGGALAGIQDDLTAASALSGAGTSLGSSPGSLAAFTTDLQGAGSGLMATIAGSGSSIIGIASAAANGIASDGSSLQEVTAQAGVLAGAVQAGGYLNRSLAGAASTAGQSQPVPTVFS